MARHFLYLRLLLLFSLISTLGFAQRGGMRGGGANFRGGFSGGGFRSGSFGGAFHGGFVSPGFRGNFGFGNRRFFFPRDRFFFGFGFGLAFPYYGYPYYPYGYPDYGYYGSSSYDPYAYSDPASSSGTYAQRRDPPPPDGNWHHFGDGSPGTLTSSVPDR